MTKRLSSILVLAVLLCSIAFGHKQHVHQYITQQGYNLLRNRLGVDVPGMSAHLGGLESYWVGDYQWQRHALTTGAWREDLEDIVYHYDWAVFPPPVNDHGLISITHFFNADNGDGTGNTFYTRGVNIGTYPNAYQKLLKFAIPYRSWHIEYRDGDFGHTSTFDLAGGGQITYTWYTYLGIEYNTLPELYTSGRAWIVGYYDTQMQWIDANARPDILPREVILGQGWRDALVWEILGRMCHLIQDQSVAAHAHGAEHAFNTDDYEDFVGGPGNPYLAWDANNAGTLPDPFVSADPLHYLMYTTQQISDHFGCGTEYNNTGNDIIGGNPSQVESDFLNAVQLSSLGAPYDGNGPFNTTTLSNQRDKTLPQAIRATSGLLFWFAKETGLWPIPGHLYVPEQYSTISAAVSNASTGDTVVVEGAQSISGYLTVNSGVTVRLNHGGSFNFASSSTRILVFGRLEIAGNSSSHVTIDGQGFSRTSYLYAPIVIASGGTASIAYSDFRNAPYLLTVYTNAGNVSIQNSSFTNFGTSGDAKAIAVTSATGTVTIASNTITGSNQGIGIYSSSNGSNVSISGNTVTCCGTGIRPYSSNASIVGNSIRNNVNYGILADNVIASTTYTNNYIQSNGYGLFLNSASPTTYQNTIIQNSANVHITSSSPTFRDPAGGGSGHNVIAYASYPLVFAENSSSPYFGHWNGNIDGNNSFYETDLPHMRALNNTCIWADGNYWEEATGSCVTDGTSLFYARNPLSIDPNPNPLGKIAAVKIGSGVSQLGISGLTDDVQVKEMISRAFAAGNRGDLTQAKDSLVWLIRNKQTSSYAPLALLVYGDFSGMKGNLVDANKSVKIESDFQSHLLSLKESPQSNPLRPYAIRFLARSAALARDLKSAMAYSGQLVKEYPGTVHEMVSLYDLLVSAIEVEQDYAKAQELLETLKKEFPESDLTISASMLCGEQVVPGSSKEKQLNQTTATDNEMAAAFPNPFNSSTTIGYQLPTDGYVKLVVYDLLGRRIAELASGLHTPGRYSASWDASSVASGVYFARLTVTDELGQMKFSKINKLILAK